ncbi:MAG: DUF5716 family protein [Lachnospiraceae bacterium]|nr:DUF5716 family protein [Lachnospiraceae bacterium]
MGRKNTGRTIIGYVLGQRYSQISFCDIKGGEPETVSAVMGSEAYNIPTVLCKKRGTNRWFYGKEAIKYAGQEEGILLENIYDLACTGEPVQVDNEEFDPVALLTLFIKRSLSLMTTAVKKEDVAAVMFTVSELNLRTVAVFDQIAIGLELPPEKVYLQSYRESIYQYVMHQPKELWNQQVLVFDYDGQMNTYRLTCNRNTTPTAVFVEREEGYLLPVLGEGNRPERIRADKERTDRSEESGTDKEKTDHPEGFGADNDGAEVALTYRKMDQEFKEFAEQMCKDRFVSSVFLVGEGFKGDWPEESLRFLCRGRRVFQGNNLYSKGACFGAREKCQPTDISTTQVFLGEDKLKANIGMKVLKRGIETYFAVLDAGQNWYELKNQCELILDDQELSFIITSLTGGVITERIVFLEGMPERAPRTTRLAMQFRMTAADRVQVVATDKGFGDFYPASGKEWVREFSTS